MRLVFAGSPVFAERALDALHRAGHDIALVLTRPDKPAQRGLKIVGLKLVRVERALAEAHYAVHRERPFFGELVDFIVSSPLVAIALEGPNAVAICRAINGATRPHEAAPGSIRGDLARDQGTKVVQILVHGSDSEESAKREIAIFFPELS